MNEKLVRLRYRYWPDHLLGEILSKRWTETAIPVIVLIVVAFALSRAIPGFLAPASLGDHRAQQVVGLAGIHAGHDAQIITAVADPACGLGVGVHGCRCHDTTVTPVVAAAPCAAATSSPISDSSATPSARSSTARAAS